MARMKIGPQSAVTVAKNGLAEKLAAELKANRDFGQPTFYEQEYSTKKMRVTVIWDEWADASLEERSAVILQAYELVEGAAEKERIALASGLTVPEATAAGLLPYRVIPARRDTDQVTPKEIEAAMIEQGASKLSPKDDLQLRFATRDEAAKCVQRLEAALPTSAKIWVISSEHHVLDTLTTQDSVQSEVT